VVTRHQGAAGTTIWVYRNDGDDRWLEMAIAPVPTGEGLALGDLDRDGDSDIAIGDRWYENADSLATGAWTEREYNATASVDRDSVVEIVDLDADGRLDVVVTPAESAGGSNRILWFEAPVDPKHGDWIDHTIASSVSTTHHSLAVVDWDRDGDLDIVTARMHQSSDPVVEVFVNQGQALQWAVEVVDDRSSHNVQAADLDGDGDTDLVGADWNSEDSPDGAPLRLWRSRTVLPEPGVGLMLALGVPPLLASRGRKRRGPPASAAPLRERPVGARARRG
jgi:hypothetical protein